VHTHKGKAPKPLRSGESALYDEHVEKLYSDGDINLGLYLNSPLRE